MSQPDRLKQSFADYVAIAISPALLIALIGSLVFFLIEVLYSGVYQGRLQWILFFYVFGIVLASRVGMTEGIANRSGLYALVLSALTWVGLLIYVKFPPENPAAPLAPFINGGLILLAWWCAYKLTWDCTNIHEDMEVPGEGLLQASGLEKVKPDPREPEPAEPEPGPTEEKAAKKEDGLAAWWERMQRYLSRKGKKRTPGVWVVYFSLAALPMFGLGQSLIPPEDDGRRRYTFWLLTVYVASGLGLLLTTCFLGLRRYLRQRRLKMPAAMTGTWLTVGGAMAAVLLLAGALMPRPQSEYPLIDLGRADSGERSASKYATKGDSPGKGEGRTGSDPKGGKGGKDGNGQGEKGNGEGAKGKAEGGKGKEQGDGSGGKQQGDKGSGGEQKGKESRDGDKSGGEKSSAQPKSRDPNRQPDRAKQAEQKNENARDGEKKDGDSRSSSDTRSGSSSSPPSMSGVVAALAKFLKWVVFGVLAALLLFFLFRSGLQFLANFTEWARNLLEWLNNFWASLFGGWGARGEGGGEEAVAAGPRKAPPKPFSAFANPFVTGNAERWSAKELLRYSFEALEAWARERDLGRHPGETPLEFAGRVGGEVPALEADVRRLVSLYARALYAAGELPANTPEPVRQFWLRLEAVAEQPLSA
jgi:hypothetical protein